jgi:aspartate aminotransferase
VSPQLSKRIEAMQASPIRKLVPFADQAKQTGTHVFHLNIGQPDIPTPLVYFDALKEFNDSVVSYAHSAGLLPLREAIANYYKREGYSYKTEDILITTGGSEALIFAITAVCDPSDSILIPEPFYTNYNGFSQSSGVEVIAVPTTLETQFRLPAKSIWQSLVQPNTKAILLNNPANPTGAALTIDEVQVIKELALEHNLFLIIDEVYREFIYDAEFLTLAKDPELKEHVIVIDSISKRFSACGARIGSLASSNKAVVQNCLKIAQSRLSVATVEQLAAVRLYQLPATFFEPIKEEYQARRDIVISALQTIPGVKVLAPQGAFYVMADLGIEDSEDFAIWMLQEFSHNNQTVMVAPGAGFYATPGKGTSEVRIAYVLQGEELQQAMKVLALGLSTYQSLR